MRQMDRRDFGRVLAAGVAGALAAPSTVGAAPVGPAPVGPGGGLTEVAGIKVGHFTDSRRPTGCTVVLTEEGAVCGVDVRGGAPGTRETDLLAPVNMVPTVHALVLSGGSAFGLDSATGVMRYLEERRIGFEVGVGRVPIVPAAILFDLGLGDWTVRPDAAAGLAAARAASSGPVAEGNVGAGAGATVGKLFGPERAMKSGLGTAAVRIPGGAVVAALVAVNAWGDVNDPRTGELVAGARDADGRHVHGTVRALLEGYVPGRAAPEGQNTTIGVVATNVSLTKAQATKVAQMAHDGLARTVQPAHTPWDGDTLFTLSTGVVRTSTPDLLVGIVAAEAVARAVVRAVQLAKGLPGLPAASDLASSRGPG
jgi:L-aminopeptidase/D-esterase-like protein